MKSEPASNTLAHILQPNGPSFYRQKSPENFHEVDQQTENREDATPIVDFGNFDRSVHKINANVIGSNQASLANLPDNTPELTHPLKTKVKRNS